MNDPTTKIHKEIFFFITSPARNTIGVAFDVVVASVVVVPAVALMATLLGTTSVATASSIEQSLKRNDNCENKRKYFFFVQIGIKNFLPTKN